MLEKFDGFQILIAAVLVGNPLPVLSAVIQIEHGCHCIHPQSVYVVLLDPVEGVGDQEIFDLVLSVIKYLCTPVGMLSLAGICVLIEGFPVKISKPVGVPGKMGGNPV